MNIEARTWADGYGAWHAQVVMTGVVDNDLERSIAQQIIHNEIVQREPELRIIPATRVRLMDRGAIHDRATTAHYKED